MDEMKLDALEGRVSKLEGDTDELRRRLIQAEYDITYLESRVSALERNASGNQVSKNYP